MINLTWKMIAYPPPKKKKNKLDSVSNQQVSDSVRHSVIAENWGSYFCLFYKLLFKRMSWIFHVYETKIFAEYYL